MSTFRGELSSTMRNRPRNLRCNGLTEETRLSIQEWRATTRESTEHESQAAVIRWANLQTVTLPELALLFAVPNGGLRDKRVAKKLAAEGVKAGVPDLCLPVPRGQHHGLFIEMKRLIDEGGRKSYTSKAQRDWHTLLEGQGYRVDVCYGFEHARDVLRDYLDCPPFSDNFVREKACRKR